MFKLNPFVGKEMAQGNFSIEDKEATISLVQKAYSRDAQHFLFSFTVTHHN